MMGPLENPKPKSLLDPHEIWGVSGIGPISSDGVNPMRKLGSHTVIGWDAPIGQYTLFANMYVRGCGKVKVTLGNQHLDVQDSSQDDDGYIQFTLSGWVDHPSSGLQFISKCGLNSTPILLYRGDLLQITPAPPPQWQIWASLSLATFLILTMFIFLHLWKR